MQYIDKIWFSHDLCGFGKVLEILFFLVLFIVGKPDDYHRFDRIKWAIFVFDQIGNWTKNGHWNETENVRNINSVFWCVNNWIELEFQLLHTLYTLYNCTYGGENKY